MLRRFLSLFARGEGSSDEKIIGVALLHDACQKTWKNRAPENVRTKAEGKNVLTREAAAARAVSDGETWVVRNIK